jgi:uncharacterized protein
MLIDFSQHSETSFDFAHVYQPGEINLDDDTVRATGATKASGKASRRQNLIAHLEGKLTGEFEVACDRCLQFVGVNLDVDFAEDFVTLETYESASAEHELTGADLSISVYDGERIDLDEIIREEILLNLPTRQVCRETCAGLCPTCGANRNRETCSCEQKEIDPRWNALKELKRST